MSTSSRTTSTASTTARSSMRTSRSTERPACSSGSQVVHKAAGLINPRQGKFNSFTIELLAVAFLVAAGLVPERQNAALAPRRPPPPLGTTTRRFVCVPACFAPFRAQCESFRPTSSTSASSTLRDVRVGVPRHRRAVALRRRTPAWPPCSPHSARPTCGRSPGAPQPCRRRPSPSGPSARPRCSPPLDERHRDPEDRAVCFVPRILPGRVVETS